MMDNATLNDIKSNIKSASYDQINKFPKSSNDISKNVSEKWAFLINRYTNCAKVPQSRPLDACEINSSLSKQIKIYTEKLIKSKLNPNVETVFMHAIEKQHAKILPHIHIKSH